MNNGASQEASSSARASQVDAERSGDRAHVLDEAHDLRPRFADARHERVEELPEHGHVEASCAGLRTPVVRVTDTGKPGFDLLVDDPSRTALAEVLARAGTPRAAIASPMPCTGWCS